MAKPAKKAKLTAADLTPPDLKQCQAMKPNGQSAMTLGGGSKLVRCTNKAFVVATEAKPSKKDGLIGSMSVCQDCMIKMQEQLGAGFCTFKPIS